MLSRDDWDEYYEAVTESRAYRLVNQIRVELLDFRRAEESISDLMEEQETRKLAFRKELPLMLDELSKICNSSGVDMPKHLVDTDYELFIFEDWRMAGDILKAVQILPVEEKLVISPFKFSELIFKAEAA